MTASIDYRQRIYRNYVSSQRRPTTTFDEAAARRRGAYLARVWRGWLPADRDAAIVDLGCGNGAVLFVCKSMGYRNLAGVDVSAEQVAIARQVTPQIVLGDALEFLALRPASFDFISALDLIEHLKKDEVFTFLDACHDALRPGGRLLLQTPNADSCLVGTVRYGDFTHESCFNPHSLTWLMKLCKFKRIEARECGPVPTGPVTVARWLLWQMIRVGQQLWNVAETGGSGSGVFTRVFVISGIKE